MTLQRYEHTGAAPQTTLAISMGAADTSFTLVSGTGYPTGAGGKLFAIGVDCGLPTEEHIICSARSGAVCTVAGGVAGRGADNTTAQGHTAPTATVEHIVLATEIDDDNDHIYTTSRDDHTQYSLTNGTRGFTGPITVSGTAIATGFQANLTGTTGRYVGRTSGIPVTGTYQIGDFANDNAGFIWLCTAGGSPGNWIQDGGITDSAWTALSYGSGWGTYSSGFAAATRRVGGRIYLRGTITGTSGTTAFTLPSGYRPSNTIIPPICTLSLNAGTIQITSAGVATPSASGTVVFDLSHISFDTL